MTVKDYYSHTRSLGAFTAEDCLRLAREAAALDAAAAAKKVPPSSLASYEVMPDGSAPIRLSFSVKVF